MQKKNVTMDTTSSNNPIYQPWSRLKLYQLMYGLPVLELEDFVTPELFSYCLKRNFFVNILAFQGEQVFLKRAFSDTLSWQLPGSSVKIQSNELFEDAVNRILQRDIPNIELAEMRPIAYLRKRYKCDGQEVEHNGLAYMGRVRSPSPEEIEQNDEIKGRFIPIRNTREAQRLIPFERRLVSFGARLLRNPESVHLTSIDNEIAETAKISKIAQIAHQFLVHPVGKRWSSKLIKHKIEQYIHPGWTLLDAACGDDDFVYGLSDSGILCFGNDVQWKQIKRLLDMRTMHNPNLFFVSHDACDLPFKVKFDLTLCKNLLHHMGTEAELDGLFQSIRRVSHRILIVDPQMPEVSGLHARAWNWWYRQVLRDQGTNFQERDSFRRLIDSHFQDAQERRFDFIKTIKGTYMFGYIDLGTGQASVTDRDHRSDFNSHEWTPVQVQTNIEAIIFDLDGLLVDTERVFFSAMDTVIRRLGGQVSLQEYVEHDLHSGTSVLDSLKDKGMFKHSSREVLDMVYVEYADLLSKGVEAMPGALEALEALGSTYRLGIASSSRREFIDIILKNLNIEGRFSVIVSRESTEKLKPHPDCFMLASKLFGVQPDQCLVVEDSLRGVKAAIEAGMPVVAVPSTLASTSVYWESAIILSSLRELTHDLIRAF